MNISYFLEFIGFWALVYLVFKYFYGLNQDKKERKRQGLESWQEIDESERVFKK